MTLMKLARQQQLTALQSWLFEHYDGYPELLNGAGLMLPGKFAGDVICQRVKGYPLTNVPRKIIYYSVNGHEWGYSGQGPHDLALDILHFYLPPNSRKEGNIIRGKIKVNRVAWEFSYQFCLDLVAPLPQGGGTIPKSQILAWLENHQILPNKSPYSNIAYAIM